MIIVKVLKVRVPHEDVGQVRPCQDGDVPFQRNEGCGGIFGWCVHNVEVEGHFVFLMYRHD